tara:strand:- start:15 stop:647 length:633 start_codon:yes stop_codon:yes gene_type:complete
MEINYIKQSNNKLFETLNNLLDYHSIQNYIPIYKHFFTMKEETYNIFNLNHTIHIKSFIDKISLNKYVVKGSDKKKRELFIKFSPIIDPIKFMCGKINESELLKLPSILDSQSDKINRYNNSSYVDGMFSYLSSLLLNNYGFYNGIDFYGTFLGIKNNFEFNITDDIEYLNQSEHYLENLNKTFFVDHKIQDQLLYNISFKNQKSFLVSL